MTACENVPRNDNLHDLVGTLENLVHSYVTKVLLYAIIFQIAVSSMHLQGPIYYLEGQNV